jgi:hypothetical protein
LLNRKDGGYHSLSVVFVQGDPTSIEEIGRSGMGLKGGDVFERYAEDEIRLSIGHGEESESRRIEEVMRGFLLSEGLKSVRCAIFRVENEGDLRRDIEGLLLRTLESMENKELRVVR